MRADGALSLVARPCESSLIPLHPVSEHIEKGEENMSMSREEAIKRLQEQNITDGSVSKTPIFKALLGLGMLLIFAIVSCFSVLTTQNLVEGGDGSGVVLHWEVFMQVFDLMRGGYTGKKAIAVIVSWTLFILYIVFGSLEVLTPDNKRQDKFFRTALLLLLFFDGVATYEYLHILPDWYRWLFTLLVPACIGFFGKHGLTLVLTSVHQFLKGN